MNLLRFSDFELDLGRMELRRNGTVLALPRVPMNLLVLLLERNGNLLTRQEIAAELWPGSDPADIMQSINNAVTRIRYTLRDNDVDHPLIQTVIGRGYRLAALVERIELPVSSSEPKDATKAEKAPEPEFIPELTSQQIKSATPSTTFAASWLWIWGAVATLCVGIAGFSLHLLRVKRLQERPTHATLVQLTAKSGGNPVMFAAISPDGHLLAYSDEDGLKLQSIEGETVRSLKGPAGVITAHLAWSTDGIHLLLSGVNQNGNKPQIWLLSITGDPPLLLRDMATFAAPSPDGRSIAFLSPDLKELWVMNISGESVRHIFTGEQDAILPVLVWSANSQTLLLAERIPFTSSVHPTAFSAANKIEYNPYYLAVDAVSGKVTASRADIWFDDACLSGGGDLILAQPKLQPDRRWDWSLVQVRIDPTTGAIASDFTELVNPGAHIFGVTSASRTSAVAAVIRQAYPRVFVGDLHWPNPALVNVRRLSLDDADAYPHSWTLDGHNVFYESRISGHNQIYRQQLDQHDAEAIFPSSLPQYSPRLTHDGQWILYSQDKSSLFRIHPSHGTPERVATQHAVSEFSCAASVDVCVLWSATPQNGTTFYALDPVHGEGKMVFQTPAAWGKVGDANISPDGRELVCLSTYGDKPQIHTVKLSSGQVAGVPVPENLSIYSINWVPAHDGWILGTSSILTGNLMYLDRKGHETSLDKTHSSRSWGVASPDGNKLAFVDLDIQGNVWMLQRK